MATFRIPPVLRSLTNNESRIPVAGSTLQEGLENLFQLYPELRDRMYDDAGELQRYVNVYVDDEDVRLAQGLQTPLADASSVIILPAMAGGAAGSSVVQR